VRTPSDEVADREVKVRVRKFLIGLLVVTFVALGAAPANAANPYNAKGYMNVPGDYAAVYVVTTGYPDTSHTYTTIFKFTGCSGGGTSCVLGGWDTNSAVHTFS